MVAKIEAEASARGRANAKKELLDLVGARRVGAARAKPIRGRKSRTVVMPKRRTSRRKRAPKGSVPRLVEQALPEQSGLTPPETLARAATEDERLIKLPSIRTELGNDRKRGRYEASGGHWSLAATGPEIVGTVETPSSEAAPCSQPGDRESRGTLGRHL